MGVPMSHVRIFDTTLRDGEQSPGFSMNTQEKIRMAHQLAALGVDIIEAGFPIASKGDLEAVLAVAKEVREVPVAALARARKDDILAAAEALKPAKYPRMHVFLATSDLHLSAKAAHDAGAGAGSDWLDDQAGAEFCPGSGIFRRGCGTHGN